MSGSRANFSWSDPNADHHILRHTANHKFNSLFAQLSHDKYNANSYVGNGRSVTVTQLSVSLLRPL